MSTVVGREIPLDIAQAFDGTNLESLLGLAILLVTVDPDGKPRPCMLSAGEVLVTEARTIRLGLWSGSSTSANLSRGSEALVCYVAQDTVCYLRGRAEVLHGDPGARLDCFALPVDRVETDTHEGLPVTSGITFAVREPEPAQLLATWERQLAAIRSAAAP